MKFKENVVAWLLVGFLVIALGNKFIRGDGAKKTAGTAPVAEEISKQGESQLRKVFTTGDWSHTTPGKAIEELLGQGWGNWVLWAIFAIIVWMIIRNFLPQAKKAGGGNSGFPTFLGLILALLLMVVLGMGVKTYIEAPKPVYASVDLRYIKVGEASESIRMTPHGIAVVQTRLPPPNTGKNFWPCPKVVAPALPKKVKFETVAGAHTTVNHIGLVEQSKLDLLPYGGITLQVVFILTESTPGISPCENLPAAK